MQQENGETSKALGYIHTNSHMTVLGTVIVVAAVVSNSVTTMVVMNVCKNCSVWSL